MSAAPDGSAHHVRPVAAAVGDERDGVGGGQRAQVGGQRQVAVGDHHVVEPLAGDGRPAGVDGPVEAEPRAPQHGRAGRRRPTGDVVVVAGDEHGQTGGGDHPFGQPPGERAALRTVEDARQAALRRAEPLDRHQHGGLHGAHCRYEAPGRAAIAVASTPRWA